MPRNLSYILQDWTRGLLHWRYWWNFALLDISLRYRRSILGPFWLTISFLMTAAGLAVVYSALFNMEIRHYIPYLVAGLASWGYVNSMINEGCTSLTRQAGTMRDQNLPILAHAIRAVVSNTVIFGHNLAVVAITVVISPTPVTWATLFALPALALLAFNGIWITLVFGLLCARYRDLPPLISVITNLLFLITPVFWVRDMLGQRGFIADFNPLYHFIELLRAPLLGSLPPLHTLAVVLGITGFGWVLTLLIALRLQTRIAYWV